MSTITIQATFNDKDFSVFQSLFKKYKVKTQIITQEKDDTEMSKAEFLEKIDRASKGKGKTLKSNQEIDDFFKKWI